jgi:hypothetical protein
MKRTRRLVIEFLHREVTITMPIAISEATGNSQEDEPEDENVPSVCPVCSSPWITVAALAGGDVSVKADRILDALQQSGLHAQVTAAGLLSICRKSFEEFQFLGATKENS